MEEFIVSARKYRPITFESVIGQKSITTTLKNAIKNKHLAHAYLFCGPRGVGKTTCARIFAKTINCYNISDEFEACNECESCISFNNNRSYSIHELDAASNNSVEDIRQLIEQVRTPPQIGSHSLYIIDEVHMLSNQAFNAFLKTLEEPPRHAIFILATTEKHKILPTILSRCQIFDFNRIRVDDTVEHLAYVAKKEGIEAEKDALNIIAQKADGAMRDALSFFDQIVSFSGEKITYKNAIDNLNVLDYDYYFKLVDAFLQNKISESLMIFNDILNNGFDGHHFISGISEHFRDLLVCKDQITLELLEVGDSIREKYKVQSANCDVSFLLSALNISNQTDLSFRDARNKRLQVELAIMKLCSITNKTTVVSTETIQVKKPEIQTQQTKTEPAINTVKGLTTKPETGISIKNMLSEKPVEKNIVQEESKTINTTNKVEYTTLSQEKLEIIWSKFAELLHNTPRLYNAFKAQKPSIENSIIQIGVSNPLLKDAIDKIKSKILQFFRAETNNETIDLNIFIQEEKSETQLYTNNDKFDYLLKKNENLTQLKNDLDLDFK